MPRALVPLLVCAVSAAADVNFERVQLDPAFRAEGVAVADFDRDGDLDVAAGTMLYLAPDWTPRPLGPEPKAFDPAGYSDAFLCWADDIDADGWLDLVVVGFPGAETSWLKNPARAAGPWPRHKAVERTGNESPWWVDLDGDGRRELLFMGDAGLSTAAPGADPTQPWPQRALAAGDHPRPGHGLGVGDINGDGRLDVTIPDGWWEAPADSAAGPWPFHPAKLSESPAQMPVMDVDGDGDGDVLSSSAHQYGVWWAEQRPDGFQVHEIDRLTSQTHALHLADLNGDGRLDFVTGKRFWAHREGDPGVDEPSLLCWYELTGAATWTRHVIDENSGVGLHIQIIDLNGDGKLDLASANKKGVHLFIQR